MVVRFSSLGDVVLAGAVTGALAPVVFVTARAWAGVARRLPGVVDVVDLAPGEGVLSLARRVPTGRLVDLHGSPRSRALAWALGRRAARVHGQRLRRRLRVCLKLGRPPTGVVQRYAKAAGVEPSPGPWIAIERRPEDLLVLVPCAAWATKRWPLEHHAALAAAWSGTVAVLAGPGDAAHVAGLEAMAGRPVQVVAERGFDGAFATLERARVVVGSDTGLLHLACAVGVPAVPLLGPTVAEDGFWVHGGHPLGRVLPCRPCALHGRDRCPLGDHACLRGLLPQAVAAHLRLVLGDPALLPGLDAPGTLGS